MSESKYVPGPWAFRQPGEFFQVGYQHDGEIVFPIATVGSPLDPARKDPLALSRANARLIAAAPDLCDLLRNILDDATGGMAGTPKKTKRVWPIRAEYHRQARAILNKAQGTNE